MTFDRDPEHGRATGDGDPAGFSKDNGMPIGLQMIGKRFDEATIYKAGYVFEQTTDFHKQTPELG